MNPGKTEKSNRPGGVQGRRTVRLTRRQGRGQGGHLGASEARVRVLILTLEEMNRHARVFSGWSEGGVTSHLQFGRSR